jgi:acyl carrier protein
VPNDVEKRLVECFQTVFPELRDTAARSASHATVPAWDSVATITLINVIEEEFSIRLDLRRAAEYESFAHLLEIIQAAAPVA